jgi:hypothetical protein
MLGAFRSRDCQPSSVAIIRSSPSPNAN